MSQTLFVDFLVKNYQGNTSLSGYALPQSPFTFIPILSSSETKISTKKILWDFGDGSTSTSITASHFYKWPGIYNISLVVYGVNGDAYVSSFTPSVSVNDFLRNELVADTIDSIELNVPAGNYVPFIISRSNSWQTYNTLKDAGYSINLYVSGSLDPLVDLNKYNNFGWSHLLQQAYFFEKRIAGNTFEYVPISAITTSTEEIYANKDSNNNFYISSKSEAGSFLVGTTGSAIAYFTSNKPKNYSSIESPLIIFCNLDSSKLDDSFTNRTNYYQNNTSNLAYLNTKPATLYAYSRFNPTTKISFSTNGIDTQGDAVLSTFQIPVISWQNTNIPFVAKLENNLDYSTIFYPLLSSDYYNMPLNVALLSGATADKKVNAKFYKEFLDTLPTNVGGYFKGYFTCSDIIPVAYLSAYAIVTDPDFFKIGTVNSVYAGNNNTVLFKERNIISSEGNNITQTFAVSPYAVTPYYGTTFAVAPSSSLSTKKNVIWGLSSSSAFTLDYTGNLIANYNLYSALGYSLSSITASSIALDKFNNAWITLFSSPYTIKITENGGVSALASKNNLTINSSAPSTPFTWSLTGGNLQKPYYVETDKNNNIWVSYYNPLYNYLIRFNPFGLYTSNIFLSSSILPDKLLVDRYNNLWAIGLNLFSSPPSIPTFDAFVDFSGNPIVTFIGNPIYSILSSTSGLGTTPLSSCNDYIFKINTTGSITASANGLNRPTSITYDLSGNIWVSHDRNTLTKIDKNTLSFTNYYVGSSFANINQQALYGLTCNTYNKLTVFNTADGCFHIIDAVTPYVSSFVVFDGNYVLDTGDDFNGYRWITKYALVSSESRFVNGLSNAFSINDNNGVYHITKQNEDFDMKAFFNSLKLPEYLIDKTVLFDDFLGSVFGSVSSQPYELGKTLYERTANFGDNTSNADTATIESLISLCRQTGTELADVIYEYPAQLRRIIDLLSIKRSKLYGSQNNYKDSFSSTSGLTPYNLGSQISTNTGTFSLSETLVIYEKFSNQYKAVKMPALSTYPGSYVLSLSSYSPNWGLPLVLPDGLSGSDVGLYYAFYRYIDTPLNNIVDSVINWSDPMTNLSFTNSAYSNWSLQDGVMDNIINYEMTKGLRLFTSAVDIVYNN